MVSRVACLYEIQKKRWETSYLFAGDKEIWIEQLSVGPRANLERRKLQKYLFCKSVLKGIVQPKTQRLPLKNVIKGSVPDLN